MKDTKRIVISRDVTFDEGNHGPRCTESSTAINTSNPLEEEAESNQQQSIDGSSSKDGDNDQQHAQQGNAEAEGAAAVSAIQPAAMSAAQPAAVSAAQPAAAADQPGAAAEPRRYPLRERRPPTE
eukprot:458670-Pelagomonas_calceolata.AAC.1